MLFLITAIVPLASSAHSLGFSLLTLNQTSQNQYQVTWQPAEALLRRDIDPQLIFPDQCRFSASTLVCPTGLEGTVEVTGLPQHAEVLLRREIRGEMAEQTVMPNAQLHVSTSEVRDGTVSAASDYLVIGIEHILLGIDHLLFVVGLILLTGFRPTLLWTITAFTASHSLSLVLSTLGIIQVPIPPVELIIALSIVLVVREALSHRQTLARRAPWLVALLFGLVHGLGFAGALADLGLPAEQKMIALGAFNIGVELGQIAVIGCLWLGWQLLRRAPAVWLRPGWTVACYGAGSLATLWSLERSWAMIQLL